MHWYVILKYIFYHNSDLGFTAFGLASCCLPSCSVFSKELSQGTRRNCGRPQFICHRLLRHTLLPNRVYGKDQWDLCCQRIAAPFLPRWRDKGTCPWRLGTSDAMQWETYVGGRLIKPAKPSIPMFKLLILL